ncbi:hypothetical protein ACVWY2_004778 [Bradyrhizobium sp. JR6.1]
MLSRLPQRLLPPRWAPTSASAKPFFWHPYHHHFWGGPGISVGFVDSGCYVTRLVMTPYGYRYRTVNVCY